MRAFIFYLVAMSVTLVVSVIGITVGWIPIPSFLSTVLAITACLMVGFKFAISDTLSSEGFQLSKTAADFALAASFAVLSLNFAQHITGHTLQGPVLLFQGRISNPFAAAWALWALTSVIFLVSLSLAIQTKKYAKKGLAYANYTRALDGLSGLVGTMSLAAYVSAIFFKGSGG